MHHLHEQRCKNTHEQSLRKQIRSIKARQATTSNDSVKLIKRVYRKYIVKEVQYRTHLGNLISPLISNCLRPNRPFYWNFLLFFSAYFDFTRLFALDRHRLLLFVTSYSVNFEIARYYCVSAFHWTGTTGARSRSSHITERRGKRTEFSGRIFSWKTVGSAQAREPTRLPTNIRLNSMTALASLHR